MSEPHENPTCPACGYDLHGVADSLNALCRCPECGQSRYPVTDSQLHAIKSMRKESKIKLIALILLMTAVPMALMYLMIWIFILLYRSYF
jgi:NADH pyrophosphatase NudC (nudix superfamily)